MPDANGNIKGAFFRAESWLRVFGPTSSTSGNDANCQGPEGDCSCKTPEVEIEFTPDWSLDGVTFTPECECEERCADPKRDDCKNPKP